MMVLGGLNNYQGKDMWSVYVRFVKKGFDDFYVDIVVEYLGVMFVELGVLVEQIVEVVGIVNLVWDDVFSCQLWEVD